MTEHSIDRLILWALTVQATPIIKSSSLANWLKDSAAKGGPRRGSAPLSPQEAHAAAAQILGHVEALEPLERACVWVKFLPKSDPRYRPAVDALAHSVLATQGTGIHSNRAARMCVEQYYSTRTSARKVREVEKVSMREALSRQRDAFERLNTIYSRAWARLDDSLHRAGYLTGE